MQQSFSSFLDCIRTFAFPYTCTKEKNCRQQHMFPTRLIISFCASYKREEENGRDFEKKRKSWAPPFSSRVISFLRLFAGKSRKWEWQKPLSFRLLFPLLPPSLSPFLLGMGLKRRRRQREGEKISSKQTPFETHFRTFTSFSLSFPQNGRAKLF